MNYPTDDDDNVKDEANEIFRIMFKEGQVVILIQKRVKKRSTFVFIKNT